MSVKISYSNLYSVGGKAINDICIGFENGVVGSNSMAMKDLEPGTLVVITDSNKRFIQISVITGKASNSEADIWIAKGGKRWKYNYKVKPCIPVTKLSSYLKYAVDSLMRGRGSDFWDTKLHTLESGYKEIVELLIKEINGE